ncbi:MAG: hypothetical protein K2X77_22305 [Candidatus Obscuribacterales bacterium]|jgi:hypothetical protein|nr:hypothetical protein [Candidatus Obscuribacterales bacterium]
MGGPFDAADNPNKGAAPAETADFSDELHSQQPGSRRFDAMNHGATLERESVVKEQPSGWFNRSSKSFDLSNEASTAIQAKLKQSWNDSEKMPEKNK